MGSCWNPLNWGDCATDAVAETGADVFVVIVEGAIEGLGKIVGTVMTWWVEIPTPDLAAGGGDNPKTSPVAWIWLHTGWITTWVAVLGLLIAAGKMAFTRRGESAVEAIKGMLTLTVVTGMGLSVISLLLEASDQFSEWIIEESYSGKEFGDAIADWLALSSLVGGIGPVLALVLTLLATISCIAQVALMMVRTIMLFILCGMLPLSAASTMTAAGQAWFRKSLAWLLAFLLYKPAAAIIYAMAFRMTAAIGDGNADSKTFLTSVCGIMLMILSVFALPALMRFATPLVQAVGSGGSGAGAAATGGALAMGAKKVASMVSQQSGGSGAPSSGGSSAPSGARPGPQPSSGGGNRPGGGNSPSPSSGQGGSPAGGAGRTSSTGSSAPAGGSGAGAGGAAAGGSGAGAGGAAAGGSGAAAGGAAAGGAAAAGGPVGIAVAAGVTAAKGAKKAAENAVGNTADGEGPSGSK
ncbi:hypothetical protein [Streptomyces sp. WMMC940]|uniref:hypothetical protein n=1 Tax=Streptomyces sp. WMMC940 TaxID=3015153 RepID=UPI0022B65732|nr:hypothetical protein [Streptomyces sp. WMMC940]MCZ7458206.1 hypothetical protein [Streptomyces sp. WMMC940]